jgi:hypothetical protein
METIVCAHCRGTGREVATISLDTGQVLTDRPCSACGGSGSVALEKSHFTTYPDQSLRFAQSLMQVHGKPVKIQIAADHDVRLWFRDGTRFILGGFTVGYRGTGPSYTQRLLNAAGFPVSLDEIAEMKPPVTLGAGLPRISVQERPVEASTLGAGLPRIPVQERPVEASTPGDALPRIRVQELLVEGSTLEGAKRRVPESIPAGSEILSVEVRRGAPEPITEMGEADSKSAAVEHARKTWIHPEWETIEEKVLREGQSGQQVVQGCSREEAKEAVWQQLGRDARLKYPVPLSPEQSLSLDRGSVREETLTVQAGSEAEAWKVALGQLGFGARLRKTVCLQSPSKGVLGLGRKEGQFEVHWLPPWYQVAWKLPWKVEVTYRRPAAVVVRFREASKTASGLD